MCIINKYRKGVPLPKRILEDIIYRIRHTILYFRNGYRTRTVLFYPSYPSKRSVLYKLLGILRYNRTNNPTRKYDIAIHWDLDTFRKPQELLQSINERVKVINADCTDISKFFIDRIHQQVFGYGTQVDPRLHKGKAVRKSNLNALHDGMVIDCPVETADEGCIYQILINNQYDDHLVEDIRIPIFRGEMPVAYLKYKPVETRFGSFLKFNAKMKKTEILAPGEMFSGEEMDCIREFAARVGLEYGEMDILRNRDDGKIYIVDTNNTPTGPSHLDKKTKKWVLGLLADTFSRNFLIQNPD